jgi:mRNA-degrading endonuclease toxin of MazEF toxin-antitoxin module
MILTRDSDLRLGEPIQVVAITTSIGESPQPYWVPVPHRTPIHLQTGLSKPSVAKCNWIREIPESRIIKVLGNMTDPEFELILDCINDLERTANSDDLI